MSGDLLNFIKSSKVHKEVMSDLVENNIVKPGNSINYIVDYIESSVKNKINYNQDKPLYAGCGFPPNISVNEVVAHYTASPNNKDYILQENDIVKVDFGVHSHGYITDSAQTFHFNSKYDEFIQASKDATNYAIDLCGVDVNLGDLGKDIEEYVKSKEVTIGEKIVCIQTAKNLKTSFLNRVQTPIQFTKPNLLVPILYFDDNSVISSLITLIFKKSVQKYLKICFF